MTSDVPKLPPDITVFERGWLSSNNVLIQGARGTALVDSGYASHAAQTVALVRAALGDRPLDHLVNTHLHSDHCGGNAALQAAWPAMRTSIPRGLAAHVRDWDPVALTYAPTGQNCPQFRFDALLLPGTEIQMGDRLWQVHAAPGHDTHSVILFEPVSRTLVSADALWQRGFGVVFPELDGDGAFDEVAATLDVIEALAPRWVVPGHGAPFTDVAQALGVARQRLARFVANPQQHLRYATKVLLKFKLLEAQSLEQSELLAWAQATPYLARLVHLQFAELPLAQALALLVDELVASGAARQQGTQLFNT